MNKPVIQYIAQHRRTHQTRGFATNKNIPNRPLLFYFMTLQLRSALVKRILSFCNKKLRFHEGLFFIEKKLNLQAYIYRS